MFPRVAEAAESFHLFVVDNVSVSKISYSFCIVLQVPLKTVTFPRYSFRTLSI
jgi:hypothetical protein